MAPKDLHSATHAKMIETAAVMRQFAGSDASRAAMEMLDALWGHYCLELIEVHPEGLVRTQSALKQVAALRDVFAGNGINPPCI